MARSNDAWGIEVGANALKAVRLVNEGDGIRVADFEVIPFKTILTTPDLNVDLEIQSILDQFMMRHEVSKSHVVVSVPGNLAFARFAKLPPVEPKKIPDIVKFEAQQQIPFPIDQVEWDYQVFMQDDSPDVEVGIFAIAKDRVMTFLSNYDERNINIDTLTLSPVAAYNAMSFDMDMDADKDAAIIMDIGTTSTDLIIVDQGRVWLRTMQIGGNNFTEALVKSFKLSFPKAEKLKREAGTSKYARQIFQAMRPVFNDLVQETQKSLGFYQTTNRDAELSKLVGLGSTFRLPGLSKFLKQQLALDVIRPDKYRKLAIDGKRASEFAEAALNMGTAYGLALQGLGLAPIQANIMPEHVVRQRLWKSKQPWVAAAAAVVFAATGAAFYTMSSAKSSYASQVAETDKIVSPAISDAEKYKDLLAKTTQTSDPRVRIENLNRILDYRDIWPRVVEDIGLATMALKPQQVLISGTSDEQQLIERGKRQRVYIETVDAQYVVSAPKEDPNQNQGSAPTEGGYYDSRYSADAAFGNASSRTPSSSGTAAANQNQDAAATPSDQPEPPSFVITIRGTTPYQNGTATFLSKHFLQWLKDNHKRSDRPYEIVTDDIKLVRNEKITEESLNADGDGNNSGRPSGGIRGGIRGGSPNPNYEGGIRGGGIRGGGIRQPIKPGGGIRQSIKPGIQPRDPSKVDPSNPDKIDAPIDPIDLLYPRKPDENKVQPGDYRFEITWTIRLRRPEDARQGLDGDGSTDDNNETPPVQPGKQAQAADKAEVRS